MLMFEIYRPKYVKTKVNCPKAQVNLATFRLFCLTALVHLPQRLLNYWAFLSYDYVLMKVFPDTHRVHLIRYLRFYSLMPRCTR